MRIFRCTVVVLLLAGLARLDAGPVQAAQGGPTAFLRKLDQDLCRRFATPKCKARTKHGTRKSIAKPPVKTMPAASQTAAPPAPPVDASVVPVILKPKPKPARLSSASPRVLLPRLRPFKLPNVPKRVAMVVPKPQFVPEVKPLLPSLEDKSFSCLSKLKDAGVTFEMSATPVGQGLCTVQVPVRLVAINVDGADILLPDRPTVNCAFALRFAGWMRERGQVIVKARTGSQITRFHTGPGYECRGRNGDISAKISEHGFGNAIDVERMKLADGRVFVVKDAAVPASEAYETLKALRQSACERFTTVLGPGTNSAHEEHFHFDLGRHGTSGTYVICQ